MRARDPLAEALKLLAQIQKKYPVTFRALLNLLRETAKDR